MIKRYDMTDHCGQHMCNCDIAETATGEYVEYSAYTALLAENAAMKDTLGHICNRGNEPEYHDCGMGGGLEDRGITDRYEAMHYGWESAMGRIYSDVIPDAMPETPATDVALAAEKKQGIEQFIAEMLERGNDPTNSLTERVRADMRSAAIFARAFIELREAK